MATSSVPQHDLSTTTKVVEALENPKLVWRTLTGLIKDTQLPREDVLHTLKNIPDDELVVSRNSSGKKLYTTRRHYKDRQSVAGKLLSILSGKVK